MRKCAFSIISLVVLYYFILFGKVECSEDISYKISDAQESYKPSSYVELLIEDLLNHNWDEDEKPCFDQILNILTNVRNSTLWATWIWDSIQLPTGQFYGSRNHLGNFDQCLRSLWPNDHPVPTQYCLVDLKLADIEPGRKLSDAKPYDNAASYFTIETKYRYKFNIMSWGICVPAICESQSVETFMRTLFRLSHFGAVNLHPYVQTLHCQGSETPQGNTGTNLLKISAVFFTITVCVCTYYTKMHGDSKSNGVVMKIVSAFDLNSNAADLMSIKKEEIKAINGIRFISSISILALHTMFMTVMVAPANGLDMDNDFNRLGKNMAHGSILVDTYFMMSGLLLMKSFKPETNIPIKPFKLLLKRYFRLIWMYIITILILINASPYIYGGPLWSKIAAREQEPCSKTWLACLLMLGNYVDSRNTCLPVSWYLPADYHLAALSTMMYWLYQKNRRRGLYIFGLITIVSLVLPGLETYFNKLNAVAVFDVESISNLREFLSMPTYVGSHMRATPYIVGLVAGYILSLYKPANHRKVISTKSSILIFIVIMVLLMKILTLGASFRFREYNALESALFAVFNRTLWASLIALGILLCEYGSLPIIADFFSWSGFVPMSRLSYGIYMLHYIFALRLTFTTRSPPLHDLFKIIQDSMGIVVMTSLLSLYILLFVEAPLNNLVALALRTKENKEKDTTTTNDSRILSKNKNM